MSSRSAAPILLAAFLSACGTLPQPFRGAPGATALRLAQPPPARLAVTPPTDALLTDAGAATYATALAAGLQDREVPAVAGPAQKGDWQVVTHAQARGATVVPSYAVIDPKGEDLGRAEGAPVPIAAWASGDEATLKASAGAAGPSIAQLLERIQAVRMQTDPNSLYNRPAKVFVADVTGAPGDGNVSLTTQIKRALTNGGEMVQDTPAGADFTVRGQVRAVPVAGGMLRVEIQWRMSDAAKHDLGMVLQLNEVPPETVTGYWGEVALKVAQEAAGGVKETILKQSGRAATPADAPATPAAPPGATPGASGASGASGTGPKPTASAAPPAAPR